MGRKVGHSRDAKKYAFLEIVREGASIGHATRLVGVGKNAPAEWRKQDPKFAADYELAFRESGIELLKEIKRRAITGTRKPVMHNGKIVYWIDPETEELAPLILREYSDTLLIYMTKARDPETYDDRVRAENIARRWDRQAAKRGEQGDTTPEKVIDLLAKLAADKAARAE